MLHLLRRAAKTWVFRGLFALLIVSFAVWGIGDLSFGGAGTRVAQVGERKITVEDYALALSRELNALSRQEQRPISVQEARDLGIADALLARIVRDAALDDEARRLGISADDAALRDAIVTSPSFQGLDGSFDEEQYRFVLDRLGFRVERFETDLRRSLARDVVARGVRGGATGAPGFARRLTEREFERRSFEAAELRLADAPDPGTPSETDLRAFHAANPGLYEAPESRSAVWIEIDPDALASEAEVPEDELRAYYEASIDRFDTPERRVADRIVFADSDAAEAARAAIEAGETSFEAAARERGLSAADIDQGELTRDDLAAGAEAVFEGGPGLVGPVPTALGPALYNVRAVLPARSRGFEEAREEIRAALARDAALELAVVRAETVADLLAAGATLEAIASETGLPLRRDAAMTREGGEGVAAAPAFVEEVFDAEPREERDVIETGGGAYALARVDAVNPAAPRPFEEVRDQVAEDWAEDRRRRALEARAADALQRLRDGGDFVEIAAELGAELRRIPPRRRAEAMTTAPAETVEALYAADAPGAVEIAASEDGLTLYRLASIEAADMSSGPAAQAAARIAQAVDASVAEDLYAYYAAAVQDRVGPTFNPAGLEQALNSLR